MLEFRTEGFKGCAVKYSPFFDSRLAVSSAANYGLAGNGRFYVLNLTPQGIVPYKHYTTQDALYDLAWSEVNENQTLAASGDGTVKLFDITVDNFPVQSYTEHEREVFSVHWNLIAKDKFCSSSWDETIKVWTPERKQSLLTLPTYSCTYSAAFSPHSPDLMSCVGSDSHLRVYDLRASQASAGHRAAVIPIHAGGLAEVPTKPGMPPTYPILNGSEALTHDWNKYRPSVIAVAGVDKIIRTFDIRQPQFGPASMSAGHTYPIRKVSWSPHISNMMLSASYDMTSRIWSDESGGLDGAQFMQGGMAPQTTVGKELGVMPYHREFVTGVDWCMFGNEGWCASVSWDERVRVWDARQFLGTV